MLPGFLSLGWNAQGIIHRARYNKLRCSASPSVELLTYISGAKLEWTPGGNRSTHASCGAVCKQRGPPYVSEVNSGLKLPASYLASARPRPRPIPVFAQHCQPWEVPMAVLSL